MSKVKKDVAMVLLKEPDQSAILVVPVADVDSSIDMSIYRSELIEEASQRIKVRRVKSETWTKSLVEFDEKQQVKLDELKANKETKLASLRKEWDEVGKALWAAQKQQADKIDEELVEKKKALLGSLTEEKSKLGTSLQKLPKDLGNGASAAYYNEREESFLKENDYESSLIVGANKRKDVIIDQMLVDFDDTDKEINSDLIFKKIWLKHLYPLIADQFEKEKGFVYTNGALPKPGNAKSFESFYSRYFDRLIKPILRFSRNKGNNDLLLLTEYFTNKLVFHCDDVSEATLYSRRNFQKVDRQTYISATYHFECGTGYESSRDFHAEVPDSRQFIFLMTALLDFGLPKEEFTISQFLDFVQRMMISETYFAVDGSSDMLKEPSLRPDLVAKLKEELHDLVAKFAENELLIISGYADYFPGLIHRKVRPTKENLEKLLMEMQGLLLRGTLEKEKVSIKADLKMVDQYLGNIDGHPEIVELKKRQAFLRGELIRSDQYVALSGEVYALEHSTFLNEEDGEQADRMVGERRQLLAEHKQYLQSTGEPDSSSVENYLIGANLDNMPFLDQELKVLLLKKVFGYKLRMVMFGAKSDQYRKSVEGRAEKRAIDMEGEFLKEFGDIFTIYGKGKLISEEIEQEASWSLFAEVKAVPPWWYKIKGFFRLDTTTKQSMFEELVVHEDLEGFCRLNEWLFKLHKVGLVLVHSADLKTRELGELHLEIARILKEKFNTLPESIEARLAIPEVDMGGLSETLSVLPSILQRQGQVQLLNSIDVAGEVSEDLADVAGKRDFDKRLALVTAANSDQEK